MTTATIDRLQVHYLVKGSGPALLMLAPGGFDAHMEKWATAGVWKGMRPLDTLADDFTIVAYDRRESGQSGGRVERLTWTLFADQAKALLDHLEIGEAYVLDGCMGCSVALAFAARYPHATRALILHWPVGGYRWKLKGLEYFTRHERFARDNGLAGVVKRAHVGKSFWQDPEADPWASVIVRDPAFADDFQKQDVARYLGLVAASGRTLFDRDVPLGAEPGGDHSHEGAGADHPRRRPVTRDVGRPLPARAAAGAGVLARHAARADAGSRARPHPRVRARPRVIPTRGEKRGRHPWSRAAFDPPATRSATEGGPAHFDRNVRGARMRPIDDHDR
jgi:pimeloyl-ACP methyl ester carboxylesterase